MWNTLVKLTVCNGSEEPTVKVESKEYKLSDIMRKSVCDLLLVDEMN